MDEDLGQGQSLQGTLADLNQSTPADQGGANATPNAYTQSDMTAQLARTPAKPPNTIAPDPISPDGSQGLNGVPGPPLPPPLPSPLSPLSPLPPSQQASPFAPPPGLSAMGHPSTNPHDHMSFGTVLRMALTPFAPQLIAHMQEIKHQRAMEDLQNREFSETLKQHAQAAQEHADLVKRESERFGYEIAKGGGQKMAQGFQPPPGDPHQYMHIGDDTWRIPTQDEQKEVKSKETITVPDYSDPTGKGTMEITQGEASKYMHDRDEHNQKMAEAQRKAATNGETTEIKEVTKPDGHLYRQVIGKDSAKVYHEVDAGPVMAGEKEADAKARIAEVKSKEGEARTMAEQRLQDHIGQQMEKFDKVVSVAQGAETDYNQAYAEQQNARTEWQDAKAALDANNGKPVDKDLVMNERIAHSKMKLAEAKADNAFGQKTTAWALAHHLPDSMKPYLKYINVGERGGVPFAEWKEGMAPGQQQAEAGGVAEGQAGQAQAGQAGAAGGVKVADPHEYAAAVSKFGKARADAWMRKNGWTMPGQQSAQPAQQSAQPAQPAQ